MAMKSAKSIPIALAAAFLAISAAYSMTPSPPAATGLWQKTDEQTGAPVGWFLFVERGGLYEGVIAADLIAKQHLEQKNRIALIVLDSTLEIAFKEYLVNESGKTYSDAQLLTVFSSRHNVHSQIKLYVRFKKDIWSKIEYYYRLRCKLVHERVTVGIDDSQIADFREVVESVLKKLHKLKFDED